MADNIDGVKGTAARLPPELPELTSKQIICLTFIFTYRQERQRPPTAAEIAQAMELKSRQAARSYIDVLEKKKCIRRDRNKARRNLIITTIGHRVLREAKTVDDSGQMPLFNLTGAHA
jgi:SOS-response transcriptional repressor LexA